MKQAKFLTGLVIATVLMVVPSACDESIVLDIDQVQPRVVVDGLITNDLTNHYVGLSWTKDFYQTGETEKITDAQVSVSDNEGNTFDFVHNPTQESVLEGYYFSENEFAGKPGNTYTLSVVVNGEVYTATDELTPVGPIDSLTSAVDPFWFALYQAEIDNALAEGNQEKIDELQQYYSVFFFSKEPQDRKDYYLFKFYRNGEEVRDGDNDIYIAEDVIVGEEIDNLEIAGYYALGDTVMAEMYSITRQTFLYYSDLSNVLNNDGGMFGPVPANPRNNLSNGALGNFQASSVSRATTIIVE